MRRPVRTGAVTLRVHTVVRRGKAYHYTRVPGMKPVRLPDLPFDHPDFLTAYVAATTAQPTKPRAAGGTIAALCDSFSLSSDFRSLSPDYARVIRKNIEAIRAKAGKGRARDLHQRHIKADLAPLSPHAAIARLKAWRLLCAYGINAQEIEENPAEGIARKRIPKTSGHAPWTPTQIAAYRAKWALDTPQRLAMEVLFWTAARISDGVRIGDGMIGRDGVLAFRQSKTGGMAYVPWTCALPAYAEACERDRVHLHAALAARRTRHMTMLATAWGKARSVKGLGNLIARAAQEAKIDRSAHGLRKARLTALADAGATVHQIASWSGHLTLNEVAAYTRESDRRRAVTGPERDSDSGKHSAGSVKPGKNAS